jgi:hypothetical protein
MKEINELVDQMVADIEDVPADVPVSYEVWAIGYDEEDELTGAAVVLGSFDDPDQAVSFARDTTLADVINLEADDGCDPTPQSSYISIEVETVVSGDEGDMNVGTIYKKTIELFEELPEYVPLTNDEFEILDDGNIQIPCNILKEYNKNDFITVVFKDAEFSEPMIYKITSKTTDGYYICEFV